MFSRRKPFYFEEKPNSTQYHPLVCLQWHASSCAFISDSISHLDQDTFLFRWGKLSVNVLTRLDINVFCGRAAGQPQLRLLEQLPFVRLDELDKTPFFPGAAQLHTQTHVLVRLICAPTNQSTNWFTCGSEDMFELDADICSTSWDCLVTKRAEDIYHPASSSERQMTSPTPPPTPRQILTAASILQLLQLSRSIHSISSSSSFLSYLFFTLNNLLLSPPMLPSPLHPLFPSFDLTKHQLYI